MSIKEITDRHKETVRYLDNAKEILRTRTGKKDNLYQDAKYVRMACGIAYIAVLLALDTHLESKGKGVKTKKSNNVNVDDYRRALRDDRKMLNDFNDVWDNLHCAGYYNGNLKSRVIAEGMEAADAIIKATQPSG